MKRYIKSSLGSNLSPLPEVKSIPYGNPIRNNRLPGISNAKSFIDALYSTGYDEFKIRTSRLSNISYSDLKDFFGAKNSDRNGWTFYKTWDTSLSGFNEVYVFKYTGE